MVMGYCIPHHIPHQITWMCYFAFTPVFYTHQGTRTSADIPSLRPRCDTVVLMRPMSETVWEFELDLKCLVLSLGGATISKTVSHDYCYRRMGMERDTIKHFTTGCSIAAKWFITFSCGNCSSPTITVLKLKYSYRMNHTLTTWTNWGIAHLWIQTGGKSHGCYPKLTQKAKVDKDIYNAQAQARVMKVHRSQSFFLKGINRLYQQMTSQKIMTP